jgi:hypothetical protein
VADHRRRLDRPHVEVAREHGVDHIVRLTNNKGLAAASRRASTPRSSSAPT